MSASEERERLRLELETFLRQKYGLGEGIAAVAEDWDARSVAMMVFRVGAGEIMATAPIKDFEAWRQ